MDNTPFLDAVFLQRAWYLFVTLVVVASSSVSFLAYFRRNPPLDKVLADLSTSVKEQLAHYVPLEHFKRELSVVDRRISGLADSAVRSSELTALKDSVDSLREDFASFRAETNRQINDLNRAIGSATAAADAMLKAAAAAQAAAQSAIELAANRTPR
jgi:phage-related tail protein